MYCRNCGKWIGDSNRLVCENCAAQTWHRPETERKQYAGTENTYGVSNNYRADGQTAYAYPTENRTHTSGLAKAIVSAALGYFGVVLSFLSLAFCAEASSSYNPVYGVSVGIVTVAVVLLISSVACAIIPFIFGLKSIHCYRDARRDRAPLPIATLILGIHGVAFAAINAFISFLAFIILTF